MARVTTTADFREAIKKDESIEADTFIASTENQSKFRVDSIGVIWKLEEGDWQCPTCSAIVEAGEPACLCQLVECLTSDDTVDLNLLPF